MYLGTRYKKDLDQKVITNRKEISTEIKYLLLKTIF